MRNRSRTFGHFVIILGLIGILAATAQLDSTFKILGSESSAQTQEFSGITVRVFCVTKNKEAPCGVGGVIVRRADNDAEVTRRTTPSEGTIQIGLNPGDYKVVPLDGSQEFSVVNKEPKRVRVVEQKFTEVKIYYQNGLK